ncbi:hypothetical protein AAGW05_16940 [Arthrobacter sp. LAPM80]|uniref:Eco57I restriction-modification methylase domain-containing protein n=1 Tax=Arthrobacter sp. LAPM80 TaxID=3141788 RepID=UPI00398ABCC2
MTFANEIRKDLDSGNLESLFIRKLGWDYTQIDQSVEFEGQSEVFLIKAIAAKKSFVVFECVGLPTNSERHQIEKLVRNVSAAHLTIFRTDREQYWQWVTARAGRTPKLNVHHYASGRGNDLVLRLQQLVFSIQDERRGLDILGVHERVDRAFRAEEVTERFYASFKEQHSRLAASILNIESDEDKSWYASLLLNRLMFLYFMQKKGFLDNDRNYLQNRLKGLVESDTSETFYSFYRKFLLPLFEMGLNRRQDEREDGLADLVGNVPYLNGGIFGTHELELQYEIEIPDVSFAEIFSFFDNWRWHLDSSGSRAAQSISPDILGYIFERYINFKEQGQKELGAYYTKEDITRYITASSVIPIFLERLSTAAEVAGEIFSPWGLLEEHPERYISLSGLDVGALSKSETKEESAVRVEHYNQLLASLRAGAVRNANDLVTFNLDTVQFAVDAISSNQSPKFAHVVWDVLSTLTVVDPTCGSGAFLFAALDIFEELYEAALSRISEEYEQNGCNADLLPEIAAVVNAVRDHPSAEYYLLKHAILNNIYGVDIMREAVEIAKLRLFLKLASVLEEGVEPDPLPDLDFNIRSGNALVGVVTLHDVQNPAHLDVFGDAEKIALLSHRAAALFANFRTAQQMHGGRVDIHKTKSELTELLNELQGKLDSRIAEVAGVPEGDIDALEAWTAATQPFHWFTQFHAVMSNGGFNCVVGNPPYVEYNPRKAGYLVEGYSTAACGDLYAFVMERSLQIVAEGGVLAMIVPISVTATPGFSSLRRVLLANSPISWTLNFAERPAKLFTGVDKRLTIWISRIGRDAEPRKQYTSAYRRWHSDERPNVFGTVQFVEWVSDADSAPGSEIPKIGTALESSVLQKLRGKGKTVGSIHRPRGAYPVFYTRKMRYHTQFFATPPLTYWDNGDVTEPSELNRINCMESDDADILRAALNSTFFFWWVTIMSDVRNLNKREVHAFPLGLESMESKNKSRLVELAKTIENNFQDNSVLKPYRAGTKESRRIQTFQPRNASTVIHQIDLVLANHFKLDDEEREFMVNWHGKFRNQTEAALDVSGSDSV